MDVVVKTLTAYAHAKSGNLKDARPLIEEASGHPASSSYMLAMCLAEAGDKDRALDWLDRSFHEHSVQLVCAKVDPGLDTLRSDARFQAVLARVGLIKSD